MPKMATEVKNPWESFECDLSAENFNEPQELFNNIKLNHFPFLKRHFSFVDYLVKCKLCGVILLPQTLISHYENRHGNSTAPEAQGNTELLPYQAVSCYNDRIDTNIKKERSVSKRSKNASGRARKGTGPIEREIGSLETISETDSLSSLTDDNLKRQPVAFSEDDVENLREPVLLKLAKSECNPNGIDVRSIIPKTDSDSKACHGDRSVWSVVCSKEATESPPSQKSRIKSQLNIEQSSANTTRDSGCGTQSCDSVSRTSGTTTHRASSYPPTPTLSPHQSSPTPSNVSDGAVFVFGKIRTEQIDRSRSRSTHSSSSSISIPNEQNELYENSNSSWYHPDSHGTAVDRKRKAGPLGRIHSRRTRPHQTVITNQTEQHESQCFQAHLLSERLETRDAEDDQFVNPFDFQDNKDIEMHNQSYQSDRFIPGLRTLSHTNKGTTARNGYHSWLRQVRGGRTASLVARDDGPLRSGYCQPHMDWRRVSGLPSELAYMEQGTGCSSWADIPQPSSSSCRSRGSIQTVVEEDKPFRISSSSLLSVGHELHEPSKDNSIDPLTHCGCIVLGNLRCRNSLLCPLHTIEEKRLVPRQRDLRQLILEARERQQLSRSLPSTLIRRVVGRPIPDTELCSPIIDLTDDASGPETSDESVENAEAVNNLRMSTFGPGLHPASRTVFRSAGTMDAQAIYHSHLRRRTKVSEAVGSRVDELSHIPSRFARRVIARDSSHPIQPGVSFGMELTPVGDPLPTVCPNVTMDTSGVGPSDPFLSVRHGSTPTDSTYLADAPTLPGLDLPNTSYSARLVAISNRPGSMSTQTRKPVRRPPPQLRRAQPVGLLQSFPPQWSAGGSDPNRNPILSQTSSGLPDASLAAPLDERDPCELVDLLLPGELMSVSGLAVDESVPDSSYRGRMIPASTPIMLSSVPVTQIPYDSHTILEHQSTHSTSLVNPSVTVNNRFARSMFSGAQVVRESQGRVVVDDIREKSITGRSRKTARTSFRHVTPVFPSSSFTGMFHPRYQYSSGPSASVVTTTPAATGSPFISGTLKSNTVTPIPPSVSGSQTRNAVFARPVAGTSSDTCLTSIVPSGLPTGNNSTDAGMSVIRRPSLVSRPLLKSSPRFLNNGPCVNPELNQYHPGSIIDPTSCATSSSSEAIDLDSCIQASSSVQSSSSTIYGSSPGRIGNESNGGSTSGSLSYMSSQTQRGPTLTTVSAPLVQTETSNALLCRNRYFVIRPGAVRQGPTGLLVRARRADTGALYSSIDGSLSQSQSVSQPPQQQQPISQPPPSAEAS